MPKFKGSCGAYSKEDALELGLTAAVIWNDILNRAEWLNTTKIYYEQNKAGDRLGIPRQTINTNLKKLESSGRIIVSGGYIPNTSIRTTFIEITDDYISDNSDDNELDDNQEAENGIPKEAENGIPYIKYDTKGNNTNIKESKERKEEADDSLTSETDDLPTKVDATTTHHVEVKTYGDDDTLLVSSRDWNKFVQQLLVSQRKGEEKIKGKLRGNDSNGNTTTVSLTNNQIAKYTVITKTKFEEEQRRKAVMNAQGAL